MSCPCSSLMTTLSPGFPVEEEATGGFLSGIKKRKLGLTKNYARKCQLCQRRKIPFLFSPRQNVISFALDASLGHSQANINVMRTGPCTCFTFSDSNDNSSPVLLRCRGRCRRCRRHHGGVPPHVVHRRRCRRRGRRGGHQESSHPAAAAAPVAIIAVTYYTAALPAGGRGGGGEERHWHGIPILVLGRLMESIERTDVGRDQ